METPNHQGNKSFSSSIPLLQTAWDSTSLGALKQCPRKYYYTIVQGWRPKGESIHLTFGIAYHSALETYDKAKAKGLDHEQATIEAVRFCLAFKDTDKADKDYSIKNRFTLTRAVVWYLDKYQEDPARTLILDNGKPAVELSFRFGTGHQAPDGEEIFLCGHLDRVCEFGDDVYVMDRKTTKSAMSDYFMQQFSPNNQMTLYSIAGQVISSRAIRGVIIDAVQLAVGFSRYARAFATRTQAQLDEWLKDFLDYTKLAGHYAEQQHWPQNDTACDKFGGCPFRKICSADPGVRELYLKSDFERKPWDPLEARD